MAADNPSPSKSTPNDDVVVVSDEALLKAESFVEAEEGAANRLMGWAGRISTTIAVVMSRFTSMRPTRSFQPRNFATPTSPSRWC